MITTLDYIGKWSDDFGKDMRFQLNASELLRRVNLLKARIEGEYGLKFTSNPITGSCVSGETFGGFRPQSCPIGAPLSAHKVGAAIDIYDPLNELDTLISKHPELLVAYDLYREHPMSTPHWLHLTIRAPNSMRRTFLP